MTTRYPDLVAISESAPVPLYRCYYNFHHEQSFYFLDSESRFSSLEADLTAIPLQEKLQQQTTDTYIEFQPTPLTRDILSIRLRSYHCGSGKGLEDLIFLFRSPPGNENVLVAQYRNENGASILPELINHLRRHFPAAASFSISKSSTILFFDKPQTNRREMTGPYLNLSFDRITGMTVGGSNIPAGIILKSDKIIEMEWSAEADKSHFAAVSRTLLTHPLFFEHSTLKTEKKSACILRWVRKI